MIAIVVINVLLALLWCFLLEKFEVGSFVAGNIVAALVQWVFRMVRGPEMDFLRRAFRPGKIVALVKLILYFTWELLKSNWQVFVLIWTPRMRVQPALIRVPIELENDVSIVLLANLISLTPGTVTMDVAEDRKSLWVHCLNVDDIPGTKQTIKERFELPLRELEK